MHSPQNRGKVNKMHTKRFTFMKSEFDPEIEILYAQILQKIRNGYEESELIPNTDKMFTYLHYMMIKPVKTSVEIFIIKLYLYKMKKFMSIFTGLNISLDELMTKIVTQLRLEEISADKVICKQGDKGDKFYLILKGTISVIIQKEYTVKMSKTDYLQFLVHLHLYQENELINRIILLNRNVYFIEEKDLTMLFTVFRLFKYFLDCNPGKYTTKFVGDFLEAERDIFILVKEKYDCSPDRCLRILGLDDLSIRTVFQYYETQYEKMQNDNMMLKKLSTGKIRSLNTRSSIFNIDKLSNVDVYTNIMNSNAISSEYIYSASKDEYCDRLEPPSISNCVVDSEVKIFKYVEVVALTDGNIFGDVALQNSSKKRTATIITKTDCFFGTLTKGGYDLCLKSTQDKVRYSKILYFLNGPIFKNVNQNIFESKYFNWFKQVELNKNTVIFTKGSTSKNIFFIRHGELELSVKLTFEELNEIIENLGGRVSEEKEKKLACDSIEFHKFYYLKKHTFRFCLLKDNEIAGLEDFMFDDKYFCDCTVASSKISIFELEENFYRNLVAEKQIKKNVEDYVTLKKKVLCQRLISVRETKIINERSKINTEKKENFQNFLKIQIKKKKERLVAPLIMSTLKNKERLHLYSPPPKKSPTTHIKCPSTPPLLPAVEKQNFFSTIDFETVQKSRLPNFKSYNLATPTAEAGNGSYSRKNINIRLSKSKSKLKKISKSKTKKRGLSMSETTLLSTQPNTTYKTLRVRKIFLSSSNKMNQPLKEYKLKYFDNRTFSPNEKDNFYYNNQHVFDSVVSNSSKTRNKGVIDFLVLDKWAEKNCQTETIH